MKRKPNPFRVGIRKHKVYRSAVCGMNFYAYIRAKRFGISSDAAINYTEHDNRYHDGRYDPATMTCKMREAEAEGDLVDVLNAEQEEFDYARRKAHEQKIAKRESAKAEKKAHSADIVRKTVEELSARNYTDADRRRVNDALSYVLSMKPVDVKLEEAVETRRKIRANKPSVLIDNMTKFFESKYNGAIDVPGLGNVNVNARSAHSIYAHGKGGLLVANAAALTGLKQLLQRSMVYAEVEKWKGREYGTISLCSMMKIGDQDWVTEFIITRSGTGKLTLYHVKCIKREIVEEGARHVAAMKGNRGKLDSSTTAHSTPNSGGGVNRDITEKSRGQSESPRLPSSNLLRQYIAANGLLSQYASA